MADLRIATSAEYDSGDMLLYVFAGVLAKAGDGDFRIVDCRHSWLPDGTLLDEVMRQIPDGWTFWVTDSDGEFYWLTKAGTDTLISATHLKFRELH